MESFSKLAPLGAIVVCMAMVALGNMRWTGKERPNGRSSQSARYGDSVTRRLEVSRAARALREATRIDLNQATGAELELLPGIGPKLSARVVAYRVQHGRFASIEELLEVSGIGRHKLERIKPFLSVDDDSVLRNNNSYLDVKYEVTCKNCGKISGANVERGDQQKGSNLQPQIKASREQVISAKHPVHGSIESDISPFQLRESVDSGAEKWNDFYDIY